MRRPWRTVEFQGVPPAFTAASTWEFQEVPPAPTAASTSLERPEPVSPQMPPPPPVWWDSVQKGILNVKFGQYMDIDKQFS